jgi:hypothetical protein
MVPHAFQVSGRAGARRRARPWDPFAGPAPHQLRPRRGCTAQKGAYKQRGGSLTPGLRGSLVRSDLVGPEPRSWIPRHGFSGGCLIGGFLRGIRCPGRRPGPRRVLARDSAMKNLRCTPSLTGENSSTCSDMPSLALTAQTMLHPCAVPGRAPPLSLSPQGAGASGQPSPPLSPTAPACVQSCSAGRLPARQHRTAFAPRSRLARAAQRAAINKSIMCVCGKWTRSGW